ncbi:EAL domain-containing protein [Alteromonas sp. ASW11-19]|uniref:EAL domain-containing protein n=1 Tax=Alteromonas salexigens TaxID=2982530 RepID=A0ABT2VQL7_9ALTE|nr:EAL domain-containing protein [Alteromonas salexigens]MCU7555597.1 EAL domain-containing protein [Alteromonas salexigens]
MSKQPAGPRNHTPAMQRDLVGMLYGNVYTAIAVTFLAMTGLAFGFNDTDSSIEITRNKELAWMLLSAVLFLRTCDVLYWQVFERDKDYNPSLSLMRFSTGAIATGLVISAYSVLLFDYMTTVELACTMVVVSALAAGSATVLSPSRPLVICYCSILLVPISLVAILVSASNLSLLGYLGLCFWVAIVINSLRANHFFRHALHIKASNETLLEEMQAERKEVARINEQLIESNLKLDNANANLEEEVLKRTDDIHRLSNRDPLTSLMNRSGFMRHLESTLKKARKMDNKIAVLFIDLDGFKQVNDSLGHQVGDRVLQEVSSRLTRFCEADHLARWGGDEFVLLLPYATENTAVAVAHAARSGITIPITLDENHINLDATIGIALFPEHGETAQALLQEADLTMYEQKRKGPGSVGVFNEGIYTALRHEQSLRDGLRYAIEKNEFTLHYQPIMYADGKRMWAAEALLRWNFKGDNIPPDVFIPLAERTGLIHDIGNWVLHRACIDAAQWQFDDSVAVSVNVSVSQLMDDSFIRSLDRVLEGSGLSPQQLHLEITESVFAENTEHVLKQIQAIKARHIQISIDDFGTGFSSLGQLHSLQFDHIKIDRAFVQKLEEGSDTIVRATLMIANEFHCLTVAEGIETAEDAVRLRAMGVNCLQGFYYARPMPARELLAWYTDN